MGGATTAPIRDATRRATSVGMSTSVASGPCGPCCSVAPVGMMTVWFVFRNASTSSVVISPRNTVAGFIGVIVIEDDGRVKPWELLGETRTPDDADMRLTR